MPTAALDRRQPLPLWAQLYDDLRTRLEAGEFTTRFPTDHELMTDYSVSRHTAREAVRALRAEGLVERERGRGSWVPAGDFWQPLGALYSLFRSIERAGVVQRSVVRALEERRDAAAAARLGLPADAALVYLERLRLAGETPLALDRAWLPARFARPLLKVDFTRTALYDELPTHCGVTPTGGWERITPVVPTGEHRRLLAIGPRGAAFALQRLTWSAAALLEWREGLVSGQRYSFVERWGEPPAGGGASPAPARGAARPSLPLQWDAAGTRP
ncbi:MAG: GntR family transcriptional regulator [Mycobacteriales bacterium]